MKPPTKPGPYWWREKEGDEWELWHVDKDVLAQPGLTCRRGFNVSTPEKLGGQWSKCPIPNELATLRAKAEAYDKGHECYGVFDESPQLVTVSARIQNNPVNGYTCRKVRVCNEVSQ